MSKQDRAGCLWACELEQVDNSQLVELARRWREECWVRVWLPRVRAGEQVAVLIREETVCVSVLHVAPARTRKIYVNNTLSAGRIPHEEESSLLEPQF